MKNERFGGFLLGKRWEEKIWKNFLDKIEKSYDARETAKILNNIFSLNEKKIVSKRIAALSLIRSGKSYKEIGKILWISPETVSALKKSIHNESGYRSARYYAVKRKNEKSKKEKNIPPSTILDYWARLPMPSKSKFKRRKS